MTMRRVVVTGLGIVSSIGVGKEAVTQSLRDATSGIVLQPDYVERGFRSQIAGRSRLSWKTISTAVRCASWDHPPAMPTWPCRKP